MLSTAVADASEIKLVVMREVNNIVAGIVDSLQLLGFFEMGNRVKCDYMHQEVTGGKNECVMSNTGISVVSRKGASNFRPAFYNRDCSSWPILSFPC